MSTRPLYLPVAFNADPDPRRLAECLRRNTGPPSLTGVHVFHEGPGPGGALRRACPVLSHPEVRLFRGVGLHDDDVLLENARWER